MLYLVVLETGCIEIVVPVAMEMLTRVHEKFILIVVLKCHLLAENGHCTSCRQFYPDKLKVVSVFVVLYCGSSKYNVFFFFFDNTGHWYQRQETGDQNTQRHLSGTASIQ